MVPGRNLVPGRSRLIKKIPSTDSCQTNFLDAPKASSFLGGVIAYARDVQNVILKPINVDAVIRKAVTTLLWSKLWHRGSILDGSIGTPANQADEGGCPRLNQLRALGQDDGYLAVEMMLQPPLRTLPGGEHA